MPYHFRREDRERIRDRAAPVAKKEKELVITRVIEQECGLRGDILTISYPAAIEYPL
jgi:hypothetical protein